MYIQCVHVAIVHAMLKKQMDYTDDVEIVDGLCIEHASQQDQGYGEGRLRVRVGRLLSSRCRRMDVDQCGDM